jgi:hypothetical protein
MNKNERLTFTPVLRKTKPMFSEQEYDKQTKIYIDRLKAAQKLKLEIKEKQTTKCNICLI